MTPAKRADAVRNRQRIVEAAQRVFTSGGDYGPESIAREAGVGIGTYYRHFPDRNDLAAAVYDDELHEVAKSAETLVEANPPLLALRRWMDRFAQRLEKKRAMGPALRSLIESRADGPNVTRALLAEAAQRILDVGMKSGDIRQGARGDDLVTALVGVCIATAESDDGEQLARLLDLLGDSVAAYGSRRFGPRNR
ncbi:TetR/AcrR family transcriptional regulator [Parafrigoribacterium soli]|uniref:TetR/AcrR family transcriptional regulator n=1 Tax=Parafrigoribacterium soli TaxID=3144663 RepID=UPI0032ED7DCC